MKYVGLLIDSEAYKLDLNNSDKLSGFPTRKNCKIAVSMFYERMFNISKESAKYYGGILNPLIIVL